MEISQIIALGAGFLIGQRMKKHKDVAFNLALLAGFVVLPVILNLLGIGGIPVFGTLTSMLIQILVGGVLLYSIYSNLVK